MDPAPMTTARLIWGFIAVIICIAFPIPAWTCLLVIGAPILLSLGIEELSRYLLMQRLGRD